MPSCSHLDQIKVTELPESVEGCEDCLAAGDPWLHLRICLECGKVGCCDDSPNRHASAHAKETGHPLIRSLEPGEEWSWCFADDFAMLIPEVTGETRIPPSPPMQWGTLRPTQSRSRQRASSPSVPSSRSSRDPGAPRWRRGSR